MQSFVGKVDLIQVVIILVDKCATSLFIQRLKNETKIFFVKARFLEVLLGVEIKINKKILKKNLISLQFVSIVSVDFFCYPSESTHCAQYFL